jgi:hypothetical protein
MDVLVIEYGDEYSSEEKELEKIVKERQAAIKKGTAEEILVELAHKEERQRMNINKLEQSMR